MTKVKICGITCEEDIRHLNKYLPDYAGFVFAESRRRVGANTVAGLAARLDGSIGKVGVFVNIRLEDLVKTALICMLDVVQLHGDETPGYIELLRKELKPGIEIWKAVRVKEESSLAGAEQYRADRFLLDAFVDGSYGGAGRRFDWNLAESAKKLGSIILAGGLNSENVNEAINMVQPFAVDVSSGVESDGIKNELKIRTFINRVRGLEAKP